MNILKEQTRSICPDCYEEIFGCVYEDNGQVYMSKKCPRHGDFTVLVEKDAWVYRQLMNKTPLSPPRDFCNIMITATHQCNLDCAICYMPNRNTPDLSLNEIKKVISQSKVKFIRISGGEPTLREDLVEIIKFSSEQGKIATVVTNGLRLADRNYLRKLKQAGLQGLHLSFNSFDDAVNKRIHGKKVLKIKMQALSNIRKEKMTVTLGVMVMDKLNKSDLNKLYRLYLKNAHFITGLRIRTAVGIGKTDNIVQQIYLSDLISMLADIIGSNKEEIVSHSLSPFSQNLFFHHDHTPCHVNINLVPLFLQRIKRGDKKDFFPKIIESVFLLISKIGLKNTLRLVNDKIRNKMSYPLRIDVRVWYDRFRIDLDEISRCPSAHLVSQTGEIVPLCCGYVKNTKTAFL